MKKIAATLAAVAMSVWAVSAQAGPLDAFKGQKGTIDIAGGTAHVPVMKKAAQAIMAANGDIRITVTGGGSGAGVKKVGEGLVNIGNTGRALKPEEVKKYGLVSFPFAIDGVAVAVNPKNPVSSLSRQQVKDILVVPPLGFLEPRPPVKAEQLEVDMELCQLIQQRKELPGTFLLPGTVQFHQ